MNTISIRGTVPDDGTVIALATWMRSGEIMFRLKVGTREFIGNIGEADMADDPITAFMMVCQWLMDNDKTEYVEPVRRFCFESPMMEQYR